MSETTSGSAEFGHGSYADVNGINLYFEEHGEGRPLVLLHGGLMSGEAFGPLVPALAAGHRVILVDLQGHGRTADVDRPIATTTMADDIAALLDHLGIEQADVVGFSLGGGVALQVGVRHPDKVRRLVTCSVNLTQEALDPQLRAQQGQVNAAAAEFMKETPMYELHQRVNPRPEDFPGLLDKIGAFMSEPMDATEDVRGLQVPTLVMAADADMAPPSHFVDVFALLGGGQRDGGWDRSGRPEGGHALAILPGTTHYDVTDSPLFAPTVLAFLDAE